MAGFYDLLGPLLRCLGPETAHGLVIAALKGGLVPASGSSEDPVLHQRLWGRDFANPIGLAAGFDKDAKVWAPMLAQGLGFVEVGTVTPRPQPGNPKPRLFRLGPDRLRRGRRWGHGAHRRKRRRARGNRPLPVPRGL